VTTHPAPFHLNESILNGDTTQGGPVKEAESRKPVFSAPLLSHNVFAGLPLPSSKTKKESTAEDEIPGASVGVEGEKNEKEYGTEKEADERERQIKQEEKDLNIAMSKTEESISEILRSANSPLPSITPTQSALHPHTTTNGSSPSLASLKQSPATTKSSPRLLPKSVLVDLLDSTISQHGKNGTGGAEPLEKEEFLKNLFELLEVRYLASLFLQLHVADTRFAHTIETKCTDAAIWKVSRASGGTRRTLGAKRSFVVLLNFARPIFLSSLTVLVYKLELSYTLYRREKESSNQLQTWILSKTSFSLFCFPPLIFCFKPQLHDASLGVERMDPKESGLLAPFHAAISFLSPFLPPPNNSQQLSPIDTAIKSAHERCTELSTNVSPYSSFD